MNNLQQPVAYALHCLIAATVLVAAALPGQYLVPQTSAAFPSPQQYRTVAGDFNNNGLVDVVCIEVLNSNGSSNGWPRYHFVPDPANNGIAPGAALSFACPGGYVFLGWPNSTAVADFTLDGTLDIALCIGLNNGATYQVVVFPGLGNGQFGPGNPTPFAYSGTALRTLDVNQDGATDILASLGPSGLLSCWVNQWPAWTVIPIAMVPGSVQFATGDFDGDSLTDIILEHSAFGPHAINVLWGLGNGAFTPLPSSTASGLPTSIPVGIPWSPGYLLITATADLDNNGCMDFVSVLGNNPAMGFWPLFCGPGRSFTQGAFQWLFWPPSATPSDAALVAADIDADGFKDLALPGGGGLQVYRGLNGQQFAATPMYSSQASYSGFNVRDMLIADFDGDSDLDVLGAPGIGLCFFRNRAIIGGGCAGFGPNPPVLGFGNPVPGNALFSTSLSGALGSAPTVLGVSLGLNNAPLFTCGVQLDTLGSVVYLPGISNALGDFSWPIPIPNTPAVHGATFYAQAAVLDPMGPNLGGLNLALTLARTVIVW